MKRIKALGLAALLGFLATPTEESSSNPSFPRPIETSVPIERGLIFGTREFYQRILNISSESKNYKTDNFWYDSDRVLLARMILGECEGCSELEKIDVAHTVINRMNDDVDWNGKTLKEVILRPYQYSAFLEDRNRKLKDPMSYNPREFLNANTLAEEVLAGKHFNKGFTHYYNPDLASPDWAGIVMRKVDKSYYHLFGKEV